MSASNIVTYDFKANIYFKEILMQFFYFWNKEEVKQNIVNLQFKIFQPKLIKQFASAKQPCRFSIKINQYLQLQKTIINFQQFYWQLSQDLIKSQRLITINEKKNNQLSINKETFKKLSELKFAQKLEETISKIKLKCMNKIKSLLVLFWNIKVQRLEQCSQ
ncbi:unnamed protein product [Paramecium sonneborni]|uniref:Uncharacterized protein n=1 Tax=Paramecium sonneborni TaxID=65129 RepID=A0A8S1PGP6_9CILI|nr:unnamed protein product [Paramecium sonneborni]